MVGFAVQIIIVEAMVGFIGLVMNDLGWMVLIELIE
jgi:hypothetical protein